MLVLLALCVTTTKLNVKLLLSKTIFGTFIANGIFSSFANFFGKKMNGLFLHVYHLLIAEFLTYFTWLGSQHRKESSRPPQHSKKLVLYLVKNKIFLEFVN